MNITLQDQATKEIKSIQVERLGDMFQVRIGGRVYQVQVEHASQGRLDLTIDGRDLHPYVFQQGSQSSVWLAGRVWTLQKVTSDTPRHLPPGSQGGNGQVTANMPGLVRAVSVAPGDQVTQGAPLVILEAMKMELRLTAPFDGRVETVHCTPGQVVERGQLLVTLV